MYLQIDNWESLQQRLLNQSIELFVTDPRELQGDERLNLIACSNRPE